MHPEHHDLYCWLLMLTLRVQVGQVVKEFGELLGWFTKMRSPTYTTPTMMNLIRWGRWGVCLLTLQIICKQVCFISVSPLLSNAGIQQSGGFCLCFFSFQQSVHWMAPFISLCPRSDSELLMRCIVIHLPCYAETPEMLTVGFPGKYKTVFISKILTSFVWNPLKKLVC